MDKKKRIAKKWSLRTKEAIIKRNNTASEFKSIDLEESPNTGRSSFGVERMNTENNEATNGPILTDVNDN